MDNEGLKALADAIVYAAELQASVQRERQQYHFIEVSSGPYNKFKFSGRVPVVLNEDGTLADDAAQQAAMREGMDNLLDFAERYAQQNGYASNPPVWRAADGNLDDAPGATSDQPRKSGLPKPPPTPQQAQDAEEDRSQDPDDRPKHWCPRHQEELVERIGRNDKPYYGHIIPDAPEGEGMCFGLTAIGEGCPVHDGEEMQYSYNAERGFGGFSHWREHPLREGRDYCNGKGYKSEK